jgi:hypothetical protein
MLAVVCCKAGEYLCEDEGNMVTDARSRELVPAGRIRFRDPAPPFGGRPPRVGSPHDPPVYEFERVKVADLWFFVHTLGVAYYREK